MISSFEKERDVSRKIAMSKDIMDFAMISGSGYFTIPEIENFYLDLAKTINDEDVTEIKYTNSFLHVMTKAYSTGGHSRVVARWINSSPKSQKHSVLLLNQEDVEIPSDIKRSVNLRNGVVYVSEHKDLFENAKYLRYISKQYSGIILHIHPDDPTAIIAYGVESFPTPIVLYNHADHNYWCGSSIVDVVADIRNNNISARYRNISESYLLRIPIESNMKLENITVNSKSVARQFLGIPLSEKVVLTVGRATKYKPIGRYEFCDIVSRILTQVPSSKCYGIGPTKETGNWTKYSKLFFPLGEISYGEKYFQYLMAADLYVDSIPIYGGTSVVDAIQAHVPVVSYKVFNPDFGDLIEGIERQCSLRNFIQLAIFLLENPQNAVLYAGRQYSEMYLYHGEKAWNRNLDILRRRIKSQKHNVYRFSCGGFLSQINDLCVFLAYDGCSDKDRRKINASSNFMFKLKNIAYRIFDKL